MPRLNRRGELVTWWSSWLDDDTTITQVCDPDRCRLETTARGAVEIVSEQGANTLLAGGGVWAAWLDGSGVRLSTGARYPEADLGAVGPDGAVAIKVARQSYGPWDVVEREGYGWRLTDGDASSIQLLGRGRALWIEGGTIRTRLMPTPIVTTPTVYSPRALEINGDWWIVYQQETGPLVLHPFDSTRGCVLTAGGDAFHPDVVSLASGVVRVVWSTGEGESWSQIRTRDVSRFDPVVDTRPPVDVPRIGRALWCGFFTFAPVSNLPANCELAVVPEQMVVRAPDGTAIATYVAAEVDGTIGALNREVARARIAYPGLPVIPYWSGVGPIPNGDWYGIEAYRKIGESLAAFEARIRRACERVPEVALICQVYSSNSGNTQDLASLVPVYARLARDIPWIRAILAFSGSGRATGLQDHPEVRPLWDRLFAGILGAPAIPTIPTVPPPDPPKPKPPDPPTVPAPFLPPAAALRGDMQVYLKLGDKFLGIDPSDGKGSVYRNRSAGGSWERVELSKHDDGTFDARFIDANRQLSIGVVTLESRPAGTFGPYEQVFATRQPEDDDGHGLLYRTDRLGAVLSIEAA